MGMIWGHGEPFQVLGNMLKATFNKYQYDRNIQNIFLEAEK